MNRVNNKELLVHDRSKFLRILWYVECVASRSYRRRCPTGLLARPLHLSEDSRSFSAGTAHLSPH